MCGVGTRIQRHFVRSQRSVHGFHCVRRASLHLCDCRKWLCALCVIVFVLSPPQEKVCARFTVCVVAGGLPHWASAGQLRCHRHDGEGPPSQEASSCQVFSSLFRGLHISKWSEVRVMCEEKGKTIRFTAEVRGWRSKGGRSQGALSFSLSHTSRKLYRKLMQFIHFFVFTPQEFPA